MGESIVAVVVSVACAVILRKTIAERKRLGIPVGFGPTFYWLAIVWALLNLVVVVVLALA